jgi:hypothetical protein
VLQQQSALPAAQKPLSSSEFRSCSHYLTGVGQWTMMMKSLAIVGFALSADI